MWAFADKQKVSTEHLLQPALDIPDNPGPQFSLNLEDFFELAKTIRLRGHPWIRPQAGGRHKAPYHGKKQLELSIESGAFAEKATTSEKLEDFFRRELLNTRQQCGEMMPTLKLRFIRLDWATHSNFIRLKFTQEMAIVAEARFVQSKSPFGERTGEDVIQRQHREPHSRAILTSYFTRFVADNVDAVEIQYL
ncbi:unnamed protein product [Dibothriocephalus latus]|uniref:Uncharacterized protein n=1 Tax=Dibothriocephalus latus TaxID=60516 RepID=A0A3P7MDM4_DIBLA|nr:unnamed protein product [Dibothriocephalus latus]